jgi:hypothetical protein
VLTLAFLAIVPNHPLTINTGSVDVENPDTTENTFEVRFNPERWTLSEKSVRFELHTAVKVSVVSDKV